VLNAVPPRSLVSGECPGHGPLVKPPGHASLGLGLPGLMLSIHLAPVFVGDPTRGAHP
jgi:hypothetical protein